MSPLGERNQAGHDQQHLQSLMANVPGAIYRCALDAHWTMELLSEEIEAISGYPPSDFLGSARRSFASVIHADDRATVEATVTRASTEGRSFQLEYRIVRADGSVAEVLERGRRVEGVDGRAWLDGVVFDITDRKRGERELRASLARQAVSNERTRIARELHDVVAHGLSVVSVQAGAARRALPEDPTSARSALEAIESCTRQALAEMRRLLEVLRQEGEAMGALAPHPGIAELDRLVDHLVGAGLPVELSTTGESRPLPPGLDVSAYRILQEALTNALKHGAHVSVDVSVCWRARALELEVLDRGDAPTGPGSLGTPGPGVGHGLVGMAERVALFDGRLATGPIEGGGFRVHAWLPLEPLRR